MQAACSGPGTESDTLTLVRQTRGQNAAGGPMRALALLVGTLLFQVVGPFFFLKGLAGTSVAQAAVLARLDQVEFYIFALALLGERLSAWDATANALTLLAPAAIGVRTTQIVGSFMILNGGIVMLSDFDIREKLGMVRAARICRTGAPALTR